MIGETISHYKILSRLGAGGMGVVYEAEDTRLGRKVAIKFLPDEASADSEAVQRFLREARVVSNLNHPHICTLYDIGTHQNKQFMVMELLDGQSLKDRIARGRAHAWTRCSSSAPRWPTRSRPPTPRAWSIATSSPRTCSSRVAARSRCSTSASPSSVKSSRGDDATTLGATDQLTTMGTTIGTVSYMSPEQARGQEIDARSDVFSAGVVLYEMATGQLPFQGATVATIFEGLLTKQPAAPSQIKAGVPPELDHIIFKALEKDRDTRYQGAAELRADLKRLKRDRDTGQITAAATAAIPGGQRKPCPRCRVRHPRGTSRSLSARRC